MFGFFKRHDVELSPTVKGRITDNGKAVSGLQIERSIIYEGFENGQPQVDYALTNTNGGFSFEGIVIKSRLPGDIFGQNQQVRQSIFIERETPIIDEDGEEEEFYFLWSTSKIWHEIQPLSALLLKLTADLQNKEVHHEVDTSNVGGRKGHPVISICYFEGEHIDTYFRHEKIVSYTDIN